MSRFFFLMVVVVVMMMVLVGFVLVESMFEGGVVVLVELLQVLCDVGLGEVMGKFLCYGMWIEGQLQDGIWIGVMLNEVGELCGLCVEGEDVVLFVVLIECLVLQVVCSEVVFGEFSCIDVVFFGGCGIMLVGEDV